MVESVNLMLPAGWWLTLTIFFATSSWVADDSQLKLNHNHLKNLKP